MKTEKLEPKHLAPYLPYGLKMKADEGTMIYEAKGINISEQFWILIKDRNGFDCQISNIKPILRPLSDLTKEIEHNGEKFVPINKLSPTQSETRDNIELWLDGTIDYGSQEYFVMELLFAWHFNVFNLPEDLYIKNQPL